MGKSKKILKTRFNTSHLESAYFAPRTPTTSSKIDFHLWPTKELAYLQYIEFPLDRPKSVERYPILASSPVDRAKNWRYLGGTNVAWDRDRARRRHVRKTAGKPIGKLRATGFSNWRCRGGRVNWRKFGPRMDCCSVLEVLSETPLYKFIQLTMYVVEIPLCTPGQVNIDWSRPISYRFDGSFRAMVFACTQCFYKLHFTSFIQSVSSKKKKKV